MKHKDRRTKKITVIILSAALGISVCAQPFTAAAEEVSSFSGTEEGTDETTDTTTDSSGSTDTDDGETSDSDTSADTESSSADSPADGGSTSDTDSSEDDETDDSSADPESDTDDPEEDTGDDKASDDDEYLDDTLEITFTDTEIADGYYVIHISAELMEEYGAAAVIGEALEEADEEATEELPYKIDIEAGEYELENCLYVRSNTYIYAVGVTFIKNADLNANMIKIGLPGKTGNGYCYENITVEGGIWDENGTSNTCIKIGHARNITLKNAVFCNCVNSHLMEAAGTDGLIVSDCTFADQELSTAGDVTLTYEAIQLDILSEDHIAGYYSEDLPLKNVEITGCTFDNVPRGIGSHTTVFNNPIQTLIITGNTFTNIRSCAVQLMNVADCTISSNIMVDVPRGIFVYTYRPYGTYLSSTIAAEDGLVSETSETFSLNTTSALTISDNIISVEGSDAYKNYIVCGIYVSGFTAEEDYTPTSGDQIPEGNYYLSDAVIEGNSVETPGYAIRVNDVCDSEIAENAVTYTGSDEDIYYGVSLCSGASDDVISENDIQGFYRGISLTGSSQAASVSDNDISGAVYGIVLSASEADAVSSNLISETLKSGIYLYGESTVEELDSNSLQETGSHSIYVYRSAVSTIENNEVNDAGGSSICLYDNASVSSISSNVLTYAAGAGIYLYKSAAAEMIKFNTISGTVGAGIRLRSNSDTDAIASNTISFAGSSGIYLENSSSAESITSNTVSSAGGSGIYIASKSETKKISSNTITGAGKYGVASNAAEADAVKNNTITDPGNHGILLSGSITASVTNNIIKNGGGRGISITSLKQDLTISGNTISKCGTDYLIYCSPQTTSYTVAVSSNVLKGKSKTLVGIRAKSGKITVKSNVITACKYPLRFTASVKGSIYQNTLSGNKYNKYLIGATMVGNLSSPTVKTGTVSSKAIRLQWGKISSSSGYQIFRSKTKAGTYTRIKTISKKSKVTYTNKGLSAQTTYYYKLRAIRDVGNSRIYGSYSSIKSAKTAKTGS